MGQREVMRIEVGNHLVTIDHAAGLVTIAGPNHNETIDRDTLASRIRFYSRMESGKGVRFAHFGAHYKTKLAACQAGMRALDAGTEVAA
ncbi:hypothetical protein [Shimia sp.]|uniref:hypothetical protein n=1 Tax=Shimia sp. TaxID=1954381 RepID=UPI003B8C47B1